MKLIYLTENINAVFYSQVLELINKIAEKNYFEEIYLAVGLRDCKNIHEVINLHPSVKLLHFKTYPMYPIFNILTEKSIFKLFESIKLDKNFIIHTRIEFLGALSYNAYLKLNNTKPNLLVDIRGSLIEEVQIYGEMNYFLKIVKLLNYKSKIKKLLNNVEAISVVSESLKIYVKNTFKTNKKIFVIPTISGKNFYYDEKVRTELRNKLNILEDETLFVFSSGSTQGWQNDSKIVHELTSKGYKILMLTKRKYNNPNIINIFVPYEDVPKYLSASDIGIINRENDIVNNVASPIKFSEYITTGLPVIANNSVDSINQIIKKSNYGSILDLESIDQKTVMNLKSINRKKISEYGSSIFGIDSVANKYLTIYKGLVNNNE